MDILEAMAIRRSDRTYKNDKVPDKLLDKFKKTFADSVRLCDLKMRLEYFPGKVVQDAMTGIVGSYGSIKNAPVWAVGISQNGLYSQENFGFAFERFVLECTMNGLGTCWVGGFFKMSELQRHAGPADDERIVCISPVGYAADRRFAERTMRTLGGLNKRKPVGERFFHGQWGVSAEKYLSDKPDHFKMIELARWVPSASNKQPAHYVVDEGRIIIAIDTTLSRNWPEFVKGDRAEDLNFLGVDAGIGMAHIHYAADALGIGGKWTIEFDEEVIRNEFSIPEHIRIVGVFNY